MADSDTDAEKTEDATFKRREDSREKGQVAYSTEFTSAVLLLAGLAAIAFLGGHVAIVAANGLGGTLGSLGDLARVELDVDGAARILQAAAQPAGLALLQVVGPLVLLAALAGFGQVGIGIASKVFEFDPAKIDPVKGLQKIFSLRSTVRTSVALAKLLLITGAVLGTGWMQLGRIAALDGLELGPALAAIGPIVMRCVLAAVLAMFFIGVIDLLYQRWQHSKDLKMSKKEVKEEHRSAEGDPHVKARIRSVQREMAQRRMMDDVPTATVVVTNPTHYAVALAYDRDNGRGAPKVVAKGVDHVAQRIKAVARENDVPTYEDVALARALHARCEIGDEVPVELYAAVAEVLAYVYRVEESAAPV